MPAVVDYRQRLASLQGAWDNLALLSHLGDDGTNLSSTREAFESLAARLVTHLGTETHKKAVLACEARAQVAIDILVRNLFERTADIGFLAADDIIARFAQEAPALRADAASGGAAEARALSLATESIQRRLAEYVAKYSVYHNVVLTAPDGEVLVQLPGGSAPARSADRLIGSALTTNGAYVESFGSSDLVPEATRALIYAHRVTLGDEVLGVLCLCFKLEDECSGIFGRLRNANDWGVLALLDEQDQVIASTDNYQLPAGARVPSAQGAHGGIVRFAGREYLALTRAAKPYQGYAGPAWRGHAMVPIERAFETQDQHAELRCSAEVLADIQRNPATFSAGLREIPRQADAIQGDLNRSVWNGSVRLSSGSATNVTFAKALLREISNMGRKTKDVFERSIDELHETVVSSVLQDSEFSASLAMELLARNLYERANDCRWWALNGTLIAALTSGKPEDAAAATGVLSHINSLYTVYSSIVLFDSSRQVIAVSRHAELVGTTIDEAWAGETLGLLDSQSYSVSRFAESALYDGKPTLIYGAALRSADRRVVGGVAVVFDTAPQLKTMLRDALPRNERGEPLPGCAALLLDRDGNVMCSTDAAFEAAGPMLTAAQEHAATDGARAARVGDKYYALGTKCDPGYREYAGIGARAVVALPLGSVSQNVGCARRPLPQCAATRTDHARHDVREFTTFAASGAWYALPTSCVIEAVDAKDLKSVTTAGAPWAGVIMHGTEAVPVVDLATLLERPHSEPPSVVILMRLAGRKSALGLLVETLGDNPEVPSERLLPIAVLEQSAATLLVEQAVQPVNPLDGLVLVINTGQLSTMLFGGAAREQPKPQQRVA
jgi:chemotaxis signal transduction protein